jgi:hypothetical protein
MALTNDGTTADGRSQYYWVCKGCRSPPGANAVKRKVKRSVYLHSAFGLIRLGAHKVLAISFLWAENAELSSARIIALLPDRLRTDQTSAYLVLQEIMDDIQIWLELISHYVFESFGKNIIFYTFTVSRFKKLQCL